MSDFDTLAAEFASDFVAHMGDEATYHPPDGGKEKTLDAVIGPLRTTEQEFYSGQELRRELREEVNLSIVGSETIARTGKLDIGRYPGERFTIANVTTEAGTTRVVAWRAAVMSIGRRNTEKPTSG